MKKFLALTLVFMLAISALTACGGKGGSPSGGDNNPPNSNDGKWPDNEYTRLLPKPNITISFSASNEKSMEVLFSGATIEQLKAYAEQVKAAGFTVNPITSDEEEEAEGVYNYYAENAEGYEIGIFKAMGQSGFSLEKPKGSSNNNNGGDDNNTQPDGFDYTKLPENVKVGFSSIDFIKIGNDFYASAGIMGYRAHSFLKYDGGVWTEYLMDVGESEWSATGKTYTADTVNAALVRDYLDDILCEYKPGTGFESGTETIAGVSVTKYVLGTLNYWYSSEYGICFKYYTSVGAVTIERSISEWDTTVTDFGDIELP